jgi:hypothetical protein
MTHVYICHMFLGTPVKQLMVLTNQKIGRCSRSSANLRNLEHSRAPDRPSLVYLHRPAFVHIL